MNLFSIAKYIIYGVGFNICFLYFNWENNELITHLSYEGIKIYSKLQLYFTKKYDIIKNNLILWNIIKKKNNIKYQVIKNNYTCEVFLKDLYILNCNYCNYIDYIIYTDQTSPISNISFYFNIPNDFIYTKCNYKFISVNLNISGTCYDIKLHSENENYFITNNRINKFTLSYILKNQFNKIIENEPYTLRFIDQNVNREEITEKDEIIFNLDNYIIKPLIINKFIFNHTITSDKIIESKSKSKSELDYNQESDLDYNQESDSDTESDSELLDFENTQIINDIEQEDTNIDYFDKSLDENIDKN